MTVISGDPFRGRPVGPGRLDRESTEPRAPAVPRQTARQEAPAANREVQSVATLQHSLSRAQAVLAGLEGFRDFLKPGTRPDPEEIRRYLAQVRYNGRPVLDTYAGRLPAIAARADAPALEALVNTVRAQIQELSTGLLRHAGAAAGAGGVTGHEDPLRAVIRGIKEANSLVRLKRENILDLLS